MWKGFGTFCLGGRLEERLEVERKYYKLLLTDKGLMKFSLTYNSSVQKNLICSNRFIHLICMILLSNSLLFVL